MSRPYDRRRRGESTPAEFAELLGIHVQTAYMLIRRGRARAVDPDMPHLRAEGVARRSGSLFISGSEVRRFRARWPRFGRAAEEAAR